MITAALSGIVVYSMLAGRLAYHLAILVSVAAAVVCLALSGHDHGDVLSIDRYAGRSAFACTAAGEKMAVCAVLLAGCLYSVKIWQPLALAGTLLVLTVWGGRGIGLRQYLNLFRIPLGFLLLSAATLLWRFTTSAQDTLLVFPWPGGYLAVTQASQQLAYRVTARALGAVSCLYFLSLSTPLTEILTTLRRWHLPAPVTDLAFLTYRFVFVLVQTVRNMQCSATSRMGYSGVLRSIRTTGAVYGTLLGKSFCKARIQFQAMESRCTGTELRFWAAERPAGSAVQRGILVGIAAVFTAMVFMG